MRIAVVTSGGDAPGMNAAVAGACAAGGDDELVGVEGGLRGLAERRVRPLDLVAASRFAGVSGTWLGTLRWPELASSGVERCRAAIAELGLDGLVVIGGGGSLAAARAIGASAGVPVAVVPATIDLDVPGSPYTLGHDSAVNHALEVLDRLDASARALPHRAFLLETLGGDTGFLARAVAAAAGTPLVLVPEEPADLDSIGAGLALQAETAYGLVVMSEGFGRAADVADAIEASSGVRVRVTVLGHAQRGAHPSALDRRLGREAGRLAVESVRTGRSALIRLGGEISASVVALDARP